MAGIDLTKVPPEGPLRGLVPLDTTMQRIASPSTVVPGLSVGKPLHLPGGYTVTVHVGPTGTGAQQASLVLDMVDERITIEPVTPYQLEMLASVLKAAASTVRSAGVPPASAQIKETP